VAFLVFILHYVCVGKKQEEKIPSRFLQLLVDSFNNKQGNISIDIAFIISPVVQHTTCAFTAYAFMQLTQLYNCNEMHE